MSDQNEINSSSRRNGKKYFITQSMHIGVGKGLFLWFLALSFIPLATVSYINYLNSFKGLTIVTQKSLTTSSKLRADYLDAYFKNILNTLEIQSTQKSNIDFLKQLKNDLNRSGMPVGKFVRSEAWHKIASEDMPELNRIRDVEKYYDIYMLDNKGNILFSLGQNDDLGSNIYDGKYSHTRFAQSCKKIIEKNSPSFSDLEFYPAENNLLTGLLGIPVHDEKGSIIGILGIQIKIDQLKEILRSDLGLGETGVSYIIGEDLITRVGSRFENDSVILHKPVVQDLSKQWNANLHGNFAPNDSLNVAQNEKMGNYANSKNVWVYGIYRNLKVLSDLGIHWAVFEEIEHSETFAFTKQIYRTVRDSLIITFLIVILFSILITRYTVKPIKLLSSWAKQVARGELVSKNIRAPQNEVGEMKESFNQMVEWVQSIADVAHSISKGDFSKNVTVRSDKDVLGQSMNEMISSFRSVVNQANQIALGDYSANIVPRSEVDTLGIALFQMTEILRKNDLEINTQVWLKTGLSTLSDRMSRKRDLKELSDDIITFIAEFLEAKPALLYLPDPVQKVLNIQSSYALFDPKQQFVSYKYGEGLVGQVATNMAPLEMTEINRESFPVLDLGIEQLTPSSYYFFPVVYEGVLVCVIQLGTLQPLTEIQKQFLQSANESIALAVNMGFSNDKLNKLLSETQNQKELLQVQQEELRQTNEELEEQTKALRLSEETLQHQKEELSVINEELEERTRALEKEKETIKVINEELRDIQGEIEKKAKDLEMASKYKSEFLANMSHELRTPLNSILVLSQLMSDNVNGNLSEKQVEFAKTIHSSGSELLSLINEILDLSKVEAGKIDVVVERFSLSVFGEQINRIIQPLTRKKGLNFSISIDEFLPEYIYNDSQRVQQILRNLLSNSVKFTEQGFIKLKISRPGDGFKSQKGQKPEDTIAFEVSDSGIGIPEEKFTLIFNAFQQAEGTTNRKYGGTGLGLTISKSFSDILGGEIFVSSKEGKGSTFILYLPEKLDLKKVIKETEEKNTGKELLIGANTFNLLQTKDVLNGGIEFEDAAADVKKKTKSKKAVSSNEPLTDGFPALPDGLFDDRNTIKAGDKFILVIEDDVTFLKIMYDLSTARGFKCLLATDGETGLYFADMFNPSAIILDIGLPGIDGFEVMERLKMNSQTRHIPVHFVSAVDKNQEAMRMGAIGYLTKPVSLDLLNEAFTKIEETISKSVKRLLVVDDEEIMRKSIVGLVDGKDVVTVAVESGEEAISRLNSEDFDCVVLDLGLKDMSGFEVLETIRNDKRLSKIPIIVYTGKDLNRTEELMLKKLSDSIIIKGARSPERLLAETTLFLHRVEANLPKEKQVLLNITGDKDAVFMEKKILVVDDDMRNVFAISAVLEDKGLTIIAAKNGKEGIDKLFKNPDVDLVIMDIMMPEMDGYEAMHLIRKDQRFSRLPIIALTAKAMKDDRQKCIDAGANDYLTKPFDPGKLISMLRVWLYR
jgi:CheY-like chemotaxis protein/signal transduction histidine kinase/HAMP domain-containing protein